MLELQNFCPGWCQLRSLGLCKEKTGSTGKASGVEALEIGLSSACLVESSPLPSSVGTGRETLLGSPRKSVPTRLLYIVIAWTIILAGFAAVLGSNNVVPYNDETKKAIQINITIHTEMLPIVFVYSSMEMGGWLAVAGWSWLGSNAYWSLTSLAMLLNACIYFSAILKLAACRNSPPLSSIRFKWKDAFFFFFFPDRDKKSVNTLVNTSQIELKNVCYASIWRVSFEIIVELECTPWQVYETPL